MCDEFDKLIFKTTTNALPPSALQKNAAATQTDRGYHLLWKANAALAENALVTDPKPDFPNHPQKEALSLP